MVCLDDVMVFRLRRRATTITTVVPHPKARVEANLLEPPNQTNLIIVIQIITIAVLERNVSDESSRIYFNSYYVITEYSYSNDYCKNSS